MSENEIYDFENEGNEPVRRRKRPGSSYVGDISPSKELVPENYSVDNTPTLASRATQGNKDLVTYSDEPTFESEIQAAIYIVKPWEKFDKWEEILAAVLNQFVQDSKGLSNAEIVKREDNYFELVNKLVIENPSWGIRQVDLNELVDLLRVYQFGYGPLEEYLNLPGLEELYFNQYNKGFYIQKGKKHRIEQQTFRDKRDMRNFLDRVCRENGIELDRSHPNIDARLKDGSRLNATIEPLVDEEDGPDFVIRKHNKQGFTIEQYVETKMVTPELVEDLRKWIKGHLTIMVAGGTGSGKTTFLNTMCNAFLPPEDRLLVLEANMRELQIEVEDMKYFQTREDPTRTGNADDITMRDLLRQTLRKRPDRIIVGEIRGVEAYYALRAWGSGHPGSLGTVHADDAIETLTVMEMLATGAGEMSENMIRKVLASSIDIVVYVERLKGQAGRRASEIVQVLHARKIDRRDKKTVERYNQLREDGTIQQVVEGDDSLLVLPLYELDSLNNIVKINEPLKLKKQTDE